jgi:RNA recognition motif-containing protein
LQRIISLTSEGKSLKTLFVSNLPSDASEESVRELFSEFGIVRSISISSDIFTGRCRGFGTVAMEGHEARAAIARLDGKTLGDKSLRVRFEDPKAKGRRRR